MDDVVALLRQIRSRLGVAGEAVRDIDRKLCSSNSRSVSTAIDIALGQLELADVLAKKTAKLLTYRESQGFSLSHQGGAEQ